MVGPDNNYVRPMESEEVSQGRSGHVGRQMQYLIDKVHVLFERIPSASARLPHSQPQRLRGCSGIKDSSTKTEQLVNILDHGDSRGDCRIGSKFSQS